MSSLSNIRTRLSAVTNIKQIATSMEMVASARFKKAQDQAKQAQFYIAKVHEILEKISAACTEFKHPLFIQRQVRKSVLVVVSSDRGLCGAYNSTLLAAADKFLQERRSEEVSLILLGKKAIQYYQNKPRLIVATFPGWSGKITLPQIQKLSEQLISGFVSNHFDAVWLAYTKFISLMHREVRVEKFLPIGKPEAKQKILNYIFEPGPELLLEQLLPRYCMTKIESLLNEAHASELAARIFSMKAAAKNAEEMIKQLTLERNKTRQASITRELLETTASMRES